MLTCFENCVNTELLKMSFVNFKFEEIRGNWESEIHEYINQKPVLVLCNINEDFKYFFNYCKENNFTFRMQIQKSYKVVCSKCGIKMTPKFRCVNFSSCNYNNELSKKLLNEYNNHVFDSSKYQPSEKDSIFCPSDLVAYDIGNNQTNAYLSTLKFFDFSRYTHLCPTDCSSSVNNYIKYYIDSSECLPTGVFLVYSNSKTVEYKKTSKLSYVKNICKFLRKKLKTPAGSQDQMTENIAEALEIFP